MRSPIMSSIMVKVTRTSEEADPEEEKDSDET